MAAARRVLDRLVAPATAGAPEVIRDGAALLVRRGSVLVRVRDAAAPGARDTAQREVAISNLLAGLEVPVVGLVDPDHQPFDVGPFVVTAWRWVAATNRPSAYDLGFVARTLRERTGIVAGAVGRAEPLTAAVEAVAALAADDPEAAFVRERARDLAGPWAEAIAADPLGRSVIHADLHRGNVVWSSAGPLLTDLELAGSGPPSYDAVPTVVAGRRYGAPAAEQAEFLRGFGADPTGWDGFEALVSVYELWVTAWAVGNGHREPAWADEAGRRVATLRDGAAHTWSLH
jgi:hypothetical protein